MQIDIKNKSYSNVLFNDSIENLRYINCVFKNSTFRQLFFNHVKFINCSFHETHFKNVKVSSSNFEGCNLSNVSIILSDFNERHFKNSSLVNLTVIQLKLKDCDEDFDYNIFFDDLWRTHVASLTLTILASMIGMELVQRNGKSRIGSK